MNVNVGLAGTCFGTFIAGVVMKYNRVKVMLILNAISILIAYPSIYVQNLTIYYIASFVGGGIQGTIMTLLPIILLETLPSAVFASANTLMMSLVTILTLMLSYLTLLMPNSENVEDLLNSKFYIWLQMAPCFCYVFLQIYF